MEKLPNITPRERMRKFLTGEKIDRIPNGLGGCETAGLHNLAYEKLKKILGVTDHKNRVCTFMTNAIFEPSVLEAMEGDVILLGTRMCPSRFWGPEADQEWKNLEIWGTKIQVAKSWNFRRDPDGSYWWNDWAKCPSGGIYFDAPFPSKIGLEFNDNQPSPNDFNPSHELPENLLRRLEEDAKWLYENTHYSITCGEIIHDLQLAPGGIQSWWMRMRQEPSECHEFLDKACDAGIAHLRQLHQAVGGYCDTLMLAHDIGDTRGVTIGPDLWREIYKPHYKRLFSEWHNITNMKISLHCCGSVDSILGDLIDCGLDIFNPTQISAEGMNPDRLNEKYSDKLIFYGGCFDSILYPPTTPDEVVYEKVKENIKILSKNGKYIFAGVHNLPGDMPESHLKAMLEAYQDCR